MWATKLIVRAFCVSNPIRIAAFFGATGVALGAFGAHGLKSILAANESLEVWRTASSYHLLHAVVLLWLAGLHPKYSKSFLFLSLGILIFSGSLYALALTNVRILGAITPLGGLMLILGWSALLFTGSKVSKGP